MEVIGVRVEMPSNQPIVLLREIDGTRFLPIWVGAVEATAIAFAQQGLEPPRPLTHDLMAQLFEKFDASLVAVHINELRDGENTNENSNKDNSKSNQWNIWRLRIHQAVNPSCHHIR